MGAVTALKPVLNLGEIMSPSRVCEIWPGMTVRKLERFRAEGKGPAYLKVGRTITYAEVDVVAYLRGHRVTTREQS